MKILVIGGGGREHAICRKLKQNNHLLELYCAPGNAGISQIATCLDISIGSPNYLFQLASLVMQNNISLTIVGPEKPLVDGIVDYFKKWGLKIFGPNKMAAKLEASKIFAKEFMIRHHIPTAKFVVFDSSHQAMEYLRMIEMPIVIKADGLAAGKGVIVANTYLEAGEAIHKIMVGKTFDNAGEKIIIEECLVGREVSILAFSDGYTLVPMLPSQDHKRIFDGDRGPNTGGMGAYSPTPIITPSIMKRIEEEILVPTMIGLREEEINYIGVIYVGLMITDEGPKVLEYNCRFGDPETEVILPALRTDLVEIMERCIDGRLKGTKVEWDARSLLSVVLSSEGYPWKYQTGKTITGWKEASNEKDVIIFHAGTNWKEGQLVTAGGRVLVVTAFGNNLNEAKEKAYHAIAKIQFEGMYFRKDIGHQAL